MVRHVGARTFRTKGDAQAWLAEERRLITLGNSRHPTNVLWGPPRRSPRDVAVPSRATRSTGWVRGSSKDQNLWMVLGEAGVKGRTFPRKIW